MKQNVTESMFRDAFRDCGRGDQFSYEALGLLYEFIEQLDEDCGTETEIDVIALCCDFYESTWEEIADNYSVDTSDCADEEEAKQVVEEYLMENTLFVGETSGSLVYAAF